MTDAIYAAGFGSPSRVYEDTARLIGMTPGAYRRGGEGLAIQYTILDTPIGRVLVAATERGVCAIMPGAGDAALEQALAEEFPKAARTRVDEGADGWLAEVVGRIAAQFADAGPPARALPADLRATAFQWQVWNALTRIPAGQTRSYAEVAREIGRPTRRPRRRPRLRLQPPRAHRPLPPRDPRRRLDGGLSMGTTGEGRIARFRAKAAFAPRFSPTVVVLL